MQWLQDPKQINFNNLKSVRREASRHFRKIRRNILKVNLIVLKLTVI